MDDHAKREEPYENAPNPMRLLESIDGSLNQIASARLACGVLRRHGNSNKATMKPSAGTQSLR